MSPLILFQGIIEELFRFRIRIPIVSPDRNALLADVPDSAAFYVIIRTIILLPGSEKKAHFNLAGFQPLTSARDQQHQNRNNDNP
jgi:hypothetical protein